MPASLWYFSGSVLAFISGVDLTKQTLPYFNDTLQGAIFLVIQHFFSAALNKGFELFEIFDLNERHAMNRMTFGLYFKENFKETLLLFLLGLPLFCLFTYFLEIGGEVFPIIILVLSVGILVIFKHLYANIIAPRINKFEELPEDLPGLPGLRREICEMT